MIFDHVVVGAGTAGCLLANRLSADPQVRVLLLEAGGEDDWHWIHIPVGYLYCIGNPRTDWMFRTEPSAGLNGRSLVYPRGKVLGGCSSINGMVYMRGQARDYDHWEALCNPGWGWRDCLPAFLAHEDHHGGTGEHHRAGGEWRVERQRLSWAILDAFAQAAVQAGIPATGDFNTGDNEGVGYFEVNQRRGIRWNTTKAFLRPAMRRPNLTVWTRAQAARLVFRHEIGEGSWDGRLAAAGVEVVRDGERLTVQAAKEIVLAAGAIGSPQLLQLSGIGPPALLQQHGIPVRHALPGVGGNLQDHLQIRAVFQVCGVPTLNRLAATWHGKLRIGLDYALRRRGPLSMAPSQLGAITRSDPAQPHPNLEYHVQPLSLDAFGQPLHDFPAFTASVCNLNPTSRGTVRIVSPRFEDAPAIAPQYLSTDADRHIAAQSLRLTRRIASMPALARYAPREFRPGVQHQSDEDLMRLAGDIGTTIFHPVGTAKMGPAGDPLAVVDPRLRVHGVAGLRIADASIMPTITSGNTNAPTLMIAERAAGWMRGLQS